MELEHEDKNWPFDQGGTTDEVARLRKQMWTAEFRPIPVRNADDSGPSPGKRPDGANWQVLARQNPPYAVEAPVSPAALNTGLLCDGLRPLDIDVEDEATAARIRMLALDMLGPGPVKTRRTASSAPSYTVRQKESRVNFTGPGPRTTARLRERA